MMDYAQKIKELYPTAATLANAAGVLEVGDDSAGGKWLLSVRDHYEYEWERILGAGYPEDEIEYAEMERSAHVQWQVFADLELWRFDADVTYSEWGTFPTRDYRTEEVPAIRVSRLRGLAADLMAEIANNLGGVMLYELQKAIEDSEDEDEES